MSSSALTSNRTEVNVAALPASQIARALLWKDFRQAAGGLVGSLGLLVGIMLLLFIMQVTSRGSMDTFQGAFLIAYSAPSLAALACVGLLIGQERQTRTWNWSSHLPVSWYSSLLSKTVVWIISSTIMLLLLLALYGVLYRICLSVGYVPMTDMSSLTPIGWLGAMLLAAVQSYLLFGVAVLLMQDALWAICLAGIGFGTVYLLYVSYLPGARTPASYAFDVGILLALSIAMFESYRWRWTNGQTIVLGDALRRAFATRATTREKTWDTCKQQGRPSEWRMLLTHAMRTGMGLRITVLLLFGFAAYNSSTDEGAVLMASVFGSALLGVSTFSSDMAMQRYRFFADRGSSRFRVFFAKSWPALLVALMGVIVLVNARGTINSSFGLYMFMVACIGHFLLGMFCALCTPSPIMALGLTLGLAVFGSMWWGTVLSTWSAHLGFPSPPVAAQLLTLISLIVGLGIQARRWLIVERPSSGRLILAVAFCGLVVPVFLACTFGFLMLPSIDSKAKAFSLADYVRAVSIPLVNRNEQLPPVADNDQRTGLLGVPGLGLHETGVQLSEFLGEDPYQGIFSIDESKLAAFAKAVNDLESKLTPDGATIEVGPWVANMAVDETITPLCRIILYSVRKGKLDIAIPAMKICRRLLDIRPQESYFLYYSLRSRTTYWQTLQSLTEEDWKALAAVTNLKELVAKPDSIDEWKAELAAHIQYSASAQNGWVDLYPPLHWYRLRQSAEMTKQATDSLTNLATPAVPGEDVVFDTVMRSDVPAIKRLLSTQSAVFSELSKIPD